MTGPGRREFLRWLGAAGVAAASRSGAAAAPRRKPNVVLFYTDDQGYADLGCFGSQDIKTPHLDQLAAEGTRFSACITPCVVCQPARASILTGLLPRTHGVHDNGIDLDPDIGEKGFAAALAATGYDTAFFR